MPPLHYSRSVPVPLRRSTADSKLLVQAAVMGLKAIYRPGFGERQAGEQGTHWSMKQNQTPQTSPLGKTCRWRRPKISLSSAASTIRTAAGISMKFYKKFALNQWNVHAFEADGSQDTFISSDMVPITKEESEQIRTAPHSAEYKEHMRQQIEALGRIKLWPPREYKEALGQICVSSASLESSMRTLIWTAAGIGSDTGMIFTGGKKSTGDLSEMLLLVAKQRAPEIVEPLKQLLKEISQSFESRGAYVHSVWTVGGDGKPFIGKFFSEKTPKTGRSISLEELEGLARRFSELEGRLTILILDRFVQSSKSAAG